jgi:hypothetical protein
MRTKVTTLRLLEMAKKLNRFNLIHSLNITDSHEGHLLDEFASMRGLEKTSSPRKEQKSRPRLRSRTQHSTALGLH